MWSGAGQGRPAAMPGHPLPIAAHLARTPSSPPATRGVQIDDRAVVTLALSQTRPRRRVGEQIEGVPGHHGEQFGAAGLGVQPPAQRAVVGADGPGSGRRGQGRGVDPGERAVGGRPSSSPRTNWEMCPRSSRKPSSQRVSTEISGVSAGTRPDATTQARNRPAESSRSSGWVVAVRSRQIRPESNRRSYEAVAVPAAMRLSPPWGHPPWSLLQCMPARRAGRLRTAPYRTRSRHPRTGRAVRRSAARPRARETVDARVCDRAPRPCHPPDRTA